MQLSLPAASFPTPAAPPACGAKNPTSPSDNADTPAGSFDSLLKQDSTPGDDSKDDKSKTGTDAEQAAGMLAALLWMQNPTATTKVPVLPSVLADGTATPEAGEVSGTDGCDDTGTGMAQAGTPFFGATNSRAFGKFQVAGAQTPVTPFSHLMVDQGAEVKVEGQGAAVATNGTPSTEATAKCATDAKPSVNASTPSAASELQNPPDGASVANQVATIVANVPAVKVAVSVKTVAKDATDGKVSAAVKDDSDSTSSEGVLSVSLLIENPAKTTPVAAAKDSPLPAAPSTTEAQEKIAPLPAVLKDLEKSAAMVVEKYFLEPAQKVVTAASTSVGIAVAKVNAVMSSAPAARTKTASLVEPSAAFVFSADPTPTATLTVDAPAPTATVRETLAAVISAVDAIERRADVQQKSVDLNFHVGNEKLGLRVELKDGAVHTTFRTESPEMNSALSREWHSVVPTAFAREVRLADPVFHTVATSGSDSSSTSLGQGAQQQQREHHKAAPTFASALRREFDDASVQEATVPAAASTTNSSQLLNALA